MQLSIFRDNVVGNSAEMNLPQQGPVSFSTPVRYPPTFQSPMTPPAGPPPAYMGTNARYAIPLATPGVRIPFQQPTFAFPAFFPQFSLAAANRLPTEEG